MSNTLMNLGVSGLNAALWGLTTTGQNISNAATPGYSVERPVYAEASGQYTSSGYMPQGVNTVTVQRQYSQYLSDQLNGAQTQSGALSTWYSLVMQLNNYIGSPTSGISTAITNYFTGMQNVANSASDASVRQTAMSNAQTLANQITAAGQQYDALRQSVNTQLTSTVTQINAYTAQIAQLNQQIASASSQGQPPNQLMDQRDLAVSNLSNLAGVQVVRNSDGYSVFLAGGTPLVVANKSYQLAAVTSPSDPSELTVVSQGIAGANRRGRTRRCPTRRCRAARSAACSRSAARRSTRPKRSSARSRPASPRRSTRRTRSASTCRATSAATCSPPARRSRTRTRAIPATRRCPCRSRTRRSRPRATTRCRTTARTTR